MWSCLVEVRYIGIEDALELLLMQDEHMIEAFLSYAPQKPLTDGVGSGSVIGRREQLDAAGPRHPHKRGSKLAIVISYQIFGSLPIGGGEPSLLGHPGIGRRACHAHMDDLA
jgi:hypothetical protein